MFHISLSGEEQQALALALECYISDLHSEIRHTDDREFRAMLKDREQMLRQILETVRPVQVGA